MNKLVFPTDPNSNQFGNIVREQRVTGPSIPATYENYQALQKVFPDTKFVQVDKAIDKLEGYKSLLETSKDLKFNDISIVEETADKGYLKATCGHLGVMIIIDNPDAFWKVNDSGYEITSGELPSILDFYRAIENILKETSKYPLKEIMDFFDKSKYFKMDVNKLPEGYYLRILDRISDKTAWAIMIKYDNGLEISIDGRDHSHRNLNDILNDFHNPYHIARFALAKNIKPGTKHKDTQLIYDDYGNRMGYMKYDDSGAFVSIELGRETDGHFTDFEELKAFIKSISKASREGLKRLSDGYSGIIKMMFPYNVNFNEIVTSDDGLRVRKYDLTNPSSPTDKTIEIVDDFNENKVSVVVDGKSYDKLEQALIAIRGFVEIE